jgi:hypothetical protein
MLVDKYVLEGYTDPKNFTSYFHITEIFVEKYKILIGINHVSNTIHINRAINTHEKSVKTIISDDFIEKCYKCYCTQLQLEEEKTDALHEFFKSIISHNNNNTNMHNLIDSINYII